MINSLGNIKRARVLAVFVFASCSSSSSTATPASNTAASNTAASKSAAPNSAVENTTSTLAPTDTLLKAVFDPSAVGTATVTGPITGGNGGTLLGVSVLDLPSLDYVQEEFFLSGTASAYTSATPLTSDGQWTVKPVSPAPYTTRIVVRRPTDQTKFKGSVLVEWLNTTSGFDNAPDWAMAHTELIRSGWTWVGVSAQAVGIYGNKGSLAAALALKIGDPVRYAPLDHPGDSYSYDMFSQAGAVVRSQWKQVLGGFEPKLVIATGESQSAFRLSTYVNAVAPLANVYDGYLIHSRGAVGAALSQDPLLSLAAPDPTLVRTDLGVPVLNFLSETDMLASRLDYRRAQQPDTHFLRVWEVPGTAHQDAYGLGIGDQDNGSGTADTALFAALTNPPKSIYGGVITCDSGLNTGPHTYVFRSAIATLEAWVKTGSAPSEMPRFATAPDGLTAVRDEFGNAIGGIRTPQLDVPLARLSGLGQTGGQFCGLFGTTVPFDSTRLGAMYPSHDAFVAKWNTAVDSAVAAGAVLPVDAKVLRAVAAASTIGNPG